MERKIVRTARLQNEIAPESFFQGTKDGAFGKPCLCSRDTRHFCHFRRFTGSGQQSPCFTGWNANSSFSPFSSKPPFFGRRDKGMVYQRHRFWDPDFYFDTKKRLNRSKKEKKDPKRVRKCLSPFQAIKNVSPALRKGKGHKHKQTFPVTARVGGGLPTGWPGVSRPVARGQKFMCCVRNPRNINIFVRVPGVTEKLFMCQMFMCLFRPLGTSLKVYHHPKCASQKVFFFTAGFCRGGHAKRLAGNLVLKIQTPSISAPLDCPGRWHFTRTSPWGIFLSGIFFFVSLDVML